VREVTRFMYGLKALICTSSAGHRRTILAVLLLAVTTFSSPAFAGGHKLDRALEAKVASGAKGSIQVIITGNTDAVRGRLAAKGRQVVAEHPSIDAITAVVDAADLEDLENDSAVRGVSLDAPVKAHQAAGSGADSWIGLDLVRTFVGANTTGLTGRGVGIAIIDSGIANIPDVHDQLAAFYDFRKTGKAAAANDTYGHGTHIAATIASSGRQNGNRYKGIAPGARLIGFQVLDGNGNGLTSSVINALTYATANRAALGIDIINLSLGHPIYESAATDPLVQAVEKAVHAGIVVVVAAGNIGVSPDTGLPGYGGITSPGNSPSALTVGSANTSGTVNRADDTVAAYSSRGPSWVDGFAKPDLVAPGHRVVADTTKSTLYNGNPAFRFAALPGWSGQYIRLSGTSMAAGVATGVAALVIEANRTTLQADGTPMAPLDPYSVKAILSYTATPLAAADGLTQGAGEINADGAVALVRALDTRTKPWMTGPLSLSSTFGVEIDSWSTNLMWGAVQLQNLAPDNAVSGANIVWGSNIVWGTNIVWSTAAGETDNIVWGTAAGENDNIVWGTAAGETDNIVWGTAAAEIDNIVWGTNLVWGTNIVWGANIVWGTSLMTIDMATVGNASCFAEGC